MLLDFLLDVFEKSVTSKKLITSDNILLNKIVNRLEGHQIEVYKIGKSELRLNGEKIKVLYRFLDDHDHLVRSFYSPLISISLTEELIKLFRKNDPLIVICILYLPKMEMRIFDLLMENYKKYCYKFADIEYKEFKFMIRDVIDVLFEDQASIGLIGISNYEISNDILTRPGIDQILKDLESTRRLEIKEKSKMGKKNWH